MVRMISKNENKQTHEELRKIEQKIVRYSHAIVMTEPNLITGNTYTKTEIVVVDSNTLDATLTIIEYLNSLYKKELIQFSESGKPIDTYKVHIHEIKTIQKLKEFIKLHTHLRMTIISTDSGKISLVSECYKTYLKDNGINIKH